MKNNSISTVITGTVVNGNLVITVPLIAAPKLTKNGKNYCVANTGDWPQNWTTVLVDGEEVGLTLCALVKNPEHPDNQAPVVPVVPPAPKFFVKKAAKPVGNVNGNGTLAAKRIMPGSCA